MRSHHRQLRHGTRTSAARRAATAVLTPLTVASVLGACSASTRTAGPRPIDTTVMFVSLASADRASVIAAAGAVTGASVARHERLIVRLVTGTASAAQAITFGPKAGGGVFRSAARNHAARRLEEADQASAARQAVDDAIAAMPTADDVGDDLNELVIEGFTMAGSIGGGGSVHIVIVSTGVQHTTTGSIVSPEVTAHPTLTVPAPSVTRSATSFFLLGIGAFQGIADNVDPALVRRVRVYANEICTSVAPAACRVIPTFDANAIASILGGDGG